MESRGCFGVVLAAALALFLVAGVAFAAQSNDSEYLPAGQIVDDDHFAQGGTVRVDGTVNGDLYAGCNDLLYSGATAGDLFAIANRSNVSGIVNGSIRLVSQETRISSTVARGISVAAMNLQVLPESRIGGNVLLAGQKVNIAAKVRGSARIVGEEVTLGGEVGKDVVIASAKPVILPGTKIGGSLTFHTDTPVHLDPSVQVAGGVKHVPTSSSWGGNRQKTDPALEAAIGLAALLVLTALMMLLIPAAAQTVSGAIRHRAGAAAFVGIIALVATPVAAILAFVTVIGRGLGFSLLAAYVSLLSGGLILGKVFAGILVGEYIFNRLLLGDKANPVASALCGATVIYAVSYTPMLGGLVSFMSFVLTVGILVLLAYDAWFLRKKTPPHLSQM